MVVEAVDFRKSIEYFFHIACIVAAISTTCWCVYIFSQDHDVCLVDFKQYNEEKEYIYPSFSLIFVNPFIEEKTSTGPVLPRMVSGWPERRPNITPAIKPDSWVADH